MTSPKHPTEAQLEARFKALAGTVPPADWEKLVRLASERMMRGLAAAELLDEASPEQLKLGIELLGAALVEYTNVAITTIAEGQLKQEMS